MAKSWRERGMPSSALVDLKGRSAALFCYRYVSSGVLQAKLPYNDDGNVCEVSAKSDTYSEVHT